MSVDGKLREIICVYDTWVLLEWNLFSLVVWKLSWRVGFRTS
jgi:hypothetical protein